MICALMSVSSSLSPLVLVFLKSEVNAANRLPFRFSEVKISLSRLAYSVFGRVLKIQLSLSNILSPNSILMPDSCYICSQNCFNSRLLHGIVVAAANCSLNKGSNLIVISCLCGCVASIATAVWIQRMSGLQRTTVCNLILLTRCCCWRLVS